jgi:glutamyl-tRNA reductase
MSLVVVGLSHRSAPVDLLEAAAVGREGLPAFVEQAAGSSHVAETVAVSTCNRVELYADVRAFHAGVGELTALLAQQTGRSLEELGPHLYVHYEDAVVQHLYSVVCGLDSMVVGEAQILGQVRDGLAAAQTVGSAGRVLNELFQQALRVGKRAHSETGIDQAGSALVTLGLGVAERALDGLQGRRSLVVGAGSMSSIAATHLARLGLGEVVVVNRTPERAQRLAEQVGGRAASLDRLEQELHEADVVVSCTGAAGFVVAAEAVARAHAARGGRPLFLLDLALPRDVDPQVHGLDRVTLVDLEDLGTLLVEHGHAAEVDAVRAIVSEEVAASLQQRQAERVAPTIIALRQRAAQVVQAELARFDGRRPNLAAEDRAEVEQTVRRVVDKLLHAPTVRVKELATDPAGLAYAEALHALFDLDPVRYREVIAADVHALEVDPEETP